MGVVARQKNDFTGPDCEAFSVLTLTPDMKITLDDVVINNQMGRRPERRPAMLARDACWRCGSGETICEWRSPIIFSRTAERFAGNFPRRSNWSPGCSARW